MALRCLTISHWGKSSWVCCASESWRGRRRRRRVWSSTGGMLVDMGGTITAEARWALCDEFFAANKIKSDATLRRHTLGGDSQSSSYELRQAAAARGVGSV